MLINNLSLLAVILFIITNLNVTVYSDLTAQDINQKLSIYKELFSTDVNAKLLSKQEVLNKLEEGRRLEIATANGGRTTMELDLISVGQLNKDSCLELNLFPKIAWLKRRFNSAPIIYNYLNQIESEKLEACRNSFPNVYQMTISKIPEGVGEDLRNLSKSIGSMGVHLHSIKSIIDANRFVNGVAAFMLPRFREFSSLQLDGTRRLTKSASFVSDTGLPGLSREESLIIMNQFFKDYRQVGKNCRFLNGLMSPLMQVVNAVGEQTLLLDSNLKDLQADAVVCQNLISRPQLASQISGVILDKLNKERMISRPKKQAQTAPKVSVGKKSRFRFKFPSSSTFKSKLN